MKKLLVFILSLAMLLTLFAGCSSAPAAETTSAEQTATTSAEQTTTAPDEQATTATTEELVNIRIGTLPFFDYTLLVAAKGLGLDKEQGLNFEIVPFPLENVAAQALINGSIDIAQGSIASFYPVWPQTPDLRVFLNNDQAKGFTIIARTGEGMKSFDEMLKENNNDYNAAQLATLKQLKGKKLATMESVYLGTINSALTSGGLTRDDIEVMNFANDGQSNAAFQSGECDLYMGGLNNTLVLLQEPDKYFTLALGEQLGVGGFWLSGTATTEKYLNDNHDTVLKLMAVHYRAAEILNSDPEKIVPYQLDYLRVNAGRKMMETPGRI